MTTPNYAGEGAASEESANHTYDLFNAEIAREYIRIKAWDRVRQLVRDEEAVGFAAAFESKIIDAACIATPGHQPYLVKKLIYLPGITMLHSDPGVGKSICAMDLAFRVGLGLTEWCGYKIKWRVRVLYIFSEGMARLWKRRDAWLKKHGYTVDHLRGWVDFYPEPIPLNASEAYVDTLITYARQHGYRLIVIDTWATANAGSDENAVGLMQQSLNRCGRIRDEVQAAVLLVHHDNRQGAFRGSSAIDGYVDTRLHAARDGEREDRRVAIKVEKQRDDEDGITWMAQLEVVDLGVDEDGDPITSVVWMHLPDATPNSRVKEASHEQIVWDFIRDHDGEYMKSDFQRAMGAGRGIPVKRIPVLVEALINKGYAFLEGRQVTEGDRKVTRKFVSVAPFLRNMNTGDRDAWWESQTQPGHNEHKEQEA
jgi:hypothetical protein